MVQESASGSTRPPAEGRRLGGGAIASLTGVGLLLIFMIQNPNASGSTSSSGSSPGRFGFSRWPPRFSGRWYGSDWTWCAVTGAARSAAKADGTDSQPALVAEPDRRR